MSCTMPEPIRILFEDHHLIAIDKPAGMVVHRGTGHHAGLVEKLREVLGQRPGGAREASIVAPVHRLDRETSGVVMFGKTEAGLRKMARLFESGEIEKNYLVLCKGVTHKKGRITIPLLARPRADRAPRDKQEHWDDEEERSLLPPDVSAESVAFEPLGEDKKLLEALTTYRKLIQVPGLSLLVVQPRTGRTHQIRRHLRSIGHPVAGDVRWGDPRCNRFLAHHQLTRPFIHAAMLSFPHPITRAPMTLWAPLPTLLQEVLASLGFAPLRPPWGPSIEGANAAPLPSPEGPLTEDPAEEDPAEE